MTDLQGADLALAVARVMGKDCRPSKKHGCVEWVTLPAGQPDSLPWGPWDPTKGGAAGAEVLEWVYAKVGGARMDVTTFDRETNEPTGYWCLITSHYQAEQWDAHGPTLWIALSRAVVAWGEQR